MTKRFTLAPHEPPANPPDPDDDPRLIPGWSPTTPHGTQTPSEHAGGSSIQDMQ